MKYLLFLLLLPTAVFSQVDSLQYDEAGKVLFSKVVAVEGTKEALYVKSKVWLNSISSRGGNSIQAGDKESGVLSSRLSAEYGFTETRVTKKKTFTDPYRSGIVSFVLTIYTKDGKAKIEIKDVVLQNQFFHAPLDKEGLMDAANDKEKGLTKQSAYKNAGALINDILLAYEKAMVKKEADF